MAAALQSLTIQVEAQGKQINAAFTAIESRIKEFESTTAGKLVRVELGLKSIAGTASTVGAAVSNLAGVFSLLASGAVVGQFGTLVKSALELGDTIDEQATKLGLSSTALQEYQGAAGLSGVKTDEFDAAIVHLNQSLAEGIADPQGSKAEAFKRLGIAIGSAGKPILDTESALRQMLERINTIPSAAQKTQLFREIFGRGGAGLITLAAEGSAGIRKIIDNLHETGNVMSPELVKAAGELNDQIDSLANGIKKNLAEALITLGPILLSVMGYLNRFSAGIKEISKDLVTNNISTGIASLTEQIDFAQRYGLTKGIEELKKQRKDLVAQLEDIANPTVATPPPPEIAIAGPNKQQQDAIKNTQKQIEALTAKNRSLVESISLNRSLAESEALATGAEAAHLTGSRQLGAQLAALTSNNKILTEVLSAQDQMQKALTTSAATIPSQLLAIRTGVAEGIPVEEIQRKLAAIAEDTSWTLMAEKAKLPGEILKRDLGKLSDTRLLKNAFDDELKRAQALQSTTNALNDSYEQEVARNTALKEGIATGTAYWKIQENIAEAIQLVTIREQGLRAGLNDNDIAQAQARAKSIDSIKQENAAMTAQVELSEKISGDITSAFFDMSKNVAGAFDTLRNLVVSVLSDIENELLKRQVTLPLSNYINAILNSLSAEQGGSLPGLSLAPPSGGANANSATWFSALTGGGAESGLSSFFTSLKTNFSSMFSSLSGGFTSLFSKTGIGSGFSSLLSIFGLHAGGMPSEGKMRMVTPSVFVGAPRYHDGLMPHEVPAILKDDEGVFTKGQMARLGRGGNTYIMNVATPDVGGFQRSHDQLLVDQRIKTEVSNRRYG